MRMPTVVITALSVVLLVYADLGSWSAYAILALVCAAAAAVSLSAEKYSAYASGLVLTSLIVCDALTRHYETELSSLHNSVTLGDLSYAAFIFALIGWGCGRLMRNKHVVQGKMEIFDPPRRPDFVISPAFARRRMPRASNQ